jgi:hypothetical protein
VFPARYELNSYIVFRKRLVSKRLRGTVMLLYGSKMCTSRKEQIIRMQGTDRSCSCAAACNRMTDNGIMKSCSVVNWLFMTPSIATKFQYINSLLFSRFNSLHFSAPTGHPEVRYTISYLKDYFNTTDPLHVCNLIIGVLFVVIGISTCSPNTCYRIEYKNKNFKIS